MMNSIGHLVTGLITGIIGLAVLAVVLSNQSNTTNVTTGFFNGLTGVINAALKPVGG
jgi:hypothetical protein